MLENKKLSDISESDIRALFDNEVREGKTIEYKRSLPGNSEREKKEFFADVSSFANTSGGHIIYGVDAKDGIPVAIPGLPEINPDAEILRLETSAQNGLEPRIPGLSSQVVSIQGSSPVIVIRIPKSWIAPHMIVFQDYSRFYARSSTGKYILDVQELRTAFMASEAISKKINSFRADRISKIISGETPIAFKNGAKIILHIVPYRFSDSSFNIDVTKIGSADKLRPIYSPGGYNSKHNLDGFVNYSTLRSTYTLLFRNGAIEAVNTELMLPEDTPLGEKLYVYYPGQVEDEIIEKIHGYLEYQESNSINTPLVIMLTFTGVKNYMLAYKYGGTVGHPIDRDILILPEVVIETYRSDIDTIMKPIFDAMWNAAGIQNDPLYDNTGKRKER